MLLLRQGVLIKKQAGLIIAILLLSYTTIAVADNAPPNSEEYRNLAYKLTKQNEGAYENTFVKTGESTYWIFNIQNYPGEDLINSVAITNTQANSLEKDEAIIESILYTANAYNLLNTIRKDDIFKIYPRKFLIPLSIELKKSSTTIDSMYQKENASSIKTELASLSRQYLELSNMYKELAENYEELDEAVIRLNVKRNPESAKFALEILKNATDNLILITNMQEGIIDSTNSLKKGGMSEQTKERVSQLSSVFSEWHYTEREEFSSTTYTYQPRKDLADQKNRFIDLQNALLSKTKWGKDSYLGRISPVIRYALDDDVNQDFATFNFIVYNDNEFFKTNFTFDMVNEHNNMTINFTVTVDQRNFMRHAEFYGFDPYGKNVTFKIKVVAENEIGIKKTDFRTFFIEKPTLKTKRDYSVMWAFVTLFVLLFILIIGLVSIFKWITHKVKRKK